MADTIGTDERIEDHEFKKPQFDARKYTSFRLPNGAEVMLIHDKDTDKASATLDVGVGSCSDPVDIPGLAHLIEHVLPRASKKYPAIDEYDQYIQKCNGHTYAYTTDSSTVYSFELTGLPDASEKSPLNGALDRFAHFFIAPLFDERTIDGHLNIVQSEHDKNMRDDLERIWQVRTLAYNSEHPMCKFSTGNLETLRDGPKSRGSDINAEIKKFYNEQYSANRMKLVIYGREPLECLEQWAVELFSTIPNKNLPRLRWDIPLYTEDRLPMQIFTQTVSDQRQLDFLFPFPDEQQKDLYKSRPSQYLCRLICHKSPGTACAILKDMGLINGLGSGVTTWCPGSAAFFVGVYLTEQGLREISAVIRFIFQYVALICEQGPQLWFMEEGQSLSMREFRFQEKTDPASTTRRLAEDMHLPYARSDLLGPSTVRELDAKAIERAMEWLDPDKCIMMLSGPSFPEDWDQKEWDMNKWPKERWYGTPHRIEKMDAKYSKEIQSAFRKPALERSIDLHLPGPNPFITTRPDVQVKDISKRCETPRLLGKSEKLEWWFKGIQQFKVPKADMRIMLCMPLLKTPRTVAMSIIFTNLVDNATQTEFAHDAREAGLTYNLGSNQSGLYLTVKGYSDKLHELLRRVLLKICHLEVRSDRFAVVKERSAKTSRDWNFAHPYHQANLYWKWLCFEDEYPPPEQLEALQDITLQNFKEFVPALLAESYIKVLAQGNLQENEALQLIDLVEEKLKPQRVPKVNSWCCRNVILPPGSKFVFKHKLTDAANVNNCLYYSLYLGKRADPVVRARTLLITQIMDQRILDRLRTSEQLGYIIWDYAILEKDWAGFTVVLQSRKRCQFLEGRIEAFLTDFRQTLAEISEKDFERHKVSVVEAQLERPKNLGEEVSRSWSYIANGTYDFKERRQKADKVMALTKAEMLEFYDLHLMPGSSQIAKLSVHMISQVKPEGQPDGVEGEDADDVVNGKLITDVNTWRKQLQRSNFPKSVIAISELSEHKTPQR